MFTAESESGHLKLWPRPIKPTMASEDVVRRMDFLYSAAHLLLPFAPDLAPNAIDRMTRLTRLEVDAAKNVALAESVARRFCGKCGTIFLPGENCKVAVETVGRKRKRGKDEGERMDDSAALSGPETATIDNEDTKWAFLHDAEAPSDAQRARTIIFPQPSSTLPKSSRRSKNNVVYTCLTCNTRTLLPGTTKSSLSDLEPGSKATSAESRATASPAPSFRPGTPTSRPGTPTLPSPLQAPGSAGSQKAKNRAKDLASLVGKQKARLEKEKSKGVKLEDFLAELR